MNTKKILMGLLVGVSLIVGCVQPNPNVGQPVVNPTTGVTNIESAYQVDSNQLQQIQLKIDQTLSSVSQLNNATAGYNPYAPQVTAGLDVAKTVEIAIPSLLAALSAAVALFKNKTAKVQTAAAATLAKSTTNAEAIANAPTPDVAHAIAVHDIAQQKVVPSA